MNHISILDCTLRDGGYVNSWSFGNKVISKIIGYLVESKVEIIECGFISEVLYNNNVSIYSDMDVISEFIESYKGLSIFVGMIALGEKEIDYKKIPVRSDKTLDGIRITFHPDEQNKAFEYAYDLQCKGYEIFMQPIGTLFYSESGLKELVMRINELNPYAFYIVDTLGTMYSSDLLSLFSKVTKILNKEIKIGFHSHNNLQMSFSNSQELIRNSNDREIIIDSSVFGMGRGAGNLCTELITQFINENHFKRYNIIPLIEIIDRYLLKIKRNLKWGYEIPYYLSAVNLSHPNYATYLLNKQTLSISAINKIINEIPEKERVLFNSTLIEELYVEFQNKKTIIESDLNELRSVFFQKDVLLMGPGSSIKSEFSKIDDFINKSKPIVIAVNFIPLDYKIDYLFITNNKRFEDIEEIINNNINEFTSIITSNININSDFKAYILNYKDYLILEKCISDNAGMILLNFMKNCNPNKIYLAGFDGFHEDASKNYYNNEYNEIEFVYLEEKNYYISNYISDCKKIINIEFITNSLYEGLNYEQI